MNQPPPQVLTLMATAAELRAGGASWEAVAPEVKRSARTCRDWTTRYPADWDRLLRAAEERLLKEAGAEALFCLRKLLRSEDPWLQQNTAKFLMSLRREACARQGKGGPAGDRPGEWAAFIAYLESLNDAQVKAFLEDFVARRLAQAGPAVPAGGGPPGPPQPG